MFEKFKILRNAERFILHRKTAHAIQEYEKLLKEDSEDPTLLNTIGDLLLKENQKDKALDYFHQVAEVYLRNGFVLRAIATYRKIHELNPSDWKVTELLADLYEKQNLNLEATRYLNNLIEYYRSRNLRTEISSSLERLAHLNPSNPDVLLDLAKVLAQQGSAARSLERFLESVALYRANAMPEKALQALGQALDVDESNKDALRAYVDVAEECGQLKAAEQFLTERMAATEKKYPFQLYTALICEKRGEKDQARALYEELDQLGFAEPGVLEGLQRTGGTSSHGTFDPLENDSIDLPAVGSIRIEDEEEPGDGAPQEKGPGEKAGDPGGGEAQDEQSSGKAKSRAGSKAAQFEITPSTFIDAQEDASALIAGEQPPTTEDLLMQEEHAEPAETRPESEEVPPLEDVSVSSLDEALEEADFYLKLGFRDEARKLLEVLITQYPRDERVLRRASKVMLTPPEESEIELAGTSKDDVDAFDLAVDSALDSLFSGVASEEPSGEVLRYDVVASNAAEKDNPKVHYDLGLAYKEMGLLQDAIQEFDRAFEMLTEPQQNPQKILCCSMLANSFLQLEKIDDAIKWANAGLKVPDMKDFEWKALQYDLAVAHQKKGMIDKALEGYRAIMARDENYRDIKNRVEQISHQVHGR